MNTLLWLFTLTAILSATDIATITYQIRMPRETYLANSQQPNDTAFFERCKQLTRENKANLENIHFLRSTSGKPADASSTLEVTYPCEREPSSTYGAVGNTKPPPREFMVPTSMLYIPEAYKPRLVGNSLNIEAADAAHKKILLRISSNKVDYLKDQIYFTHKDHRSNVLEIKQPIFYQQEVSHSTTLRNSEPVFIGMTHPCDSTGKRNSNEVILHFVIAEKSP